jgi:phosphoribosylaminoimidazolecarboxamide formyltransferase/IMP cyclohydrolase
MRIVVLISGNGSNLQALLHASFAGRITGRVVAVFSNRAEAYGLERAHRAGVPAEAILLKSFENRTAYDTALADRVAEAAPDLVVLAGFMHILGPAFLDRFPGRVINLHPALPGAFPGKDAVSRAFLAWQAGQVTETGVMVHLVVPEVDAGPVLVAERVPFEPGDTLERVEARMHAVEHRLLVEGVARWRPPSAPTKRALLSVHDKTGVVALAHELVALGFELIASGGTAKALESAGLAVTAVEAVTGFPELLGGRVKTLHPAIHAGLLARPDQQDELRMRGLVPIEVLVCNLYPFAQTIAGGATEAEALEQIDIGGVTLLRAAAKNHPAVAVVCRPSDYASLIKGLRDGDLDRRALARAAFQHTAAYDAAIATWLSEGDPLPATLTVAAERIEVLRYGENPHQSAALYRPAGQPPAFVQVQGEALSFNNRVDLEAAWAAAASFTEPAVAIIKHANPCGLAIGADAVAAFHAALASDSVSAYGSVIACNQVVDAAWVAALGKLFVEVLVAPGFSDEARELLVRRKKLRVLQAHGVHAPTTRISRIADGYLVQTADADDPEGAGWQVVTERAPTEAERADLAFAWRVVRHVRSNAIVFARQGATVGVGAGQMNRLQSVRLAAEQAGERAQGCALASDAFFPFSDGLEAAAAAGVTAVIQPGGSIRDDEVIAAANRLGLAMIFTGRRHFLH